jgi:hypothetical protein
MQLPEYRSVYLYRFYSKEKNMLRHAFILLFCLICAAPSIGFAAALENALQGTVIDSATQAPLPGVSIRINGSSKGTYSGSKGVFRLPVKNSKSLVRFSLVGYQPLEQILETGSPAPIIIKLKPSSIRTGNVEVMAELPARQIISRAIAKKEENQKKIHTLEATLYSKINFDIDGQTFGRLKDKDKTGILESFSKLYQDFDNDKRHIVLQQRRQTANISADNNLAVFTNFISFYAERIPIQNASITGPLADDAFSVYDYQVKERIMLDEKLVYVLTVKPITTTYPAFQGTLKIIDGTYNLIEADLQPTGTSAIAFIKDLRFEQKFEQMPGDLWVPAYLTISARANVQIIQGLAEVDALFTGTSIAGDIKVNQPIPDSIFAPREITDFEDMREDKEDKKPRKDYTLRARNGFFTINSDADSIRKEFWDENGLSSLSEDEKSKYAKVDSIVKNSSEFDDENTNAASFDYSPRLNFHRAGGWIPGIALALNGKKININSTIQYAFGSKKLLAGLGGRLQLNRYMQLNARLFNDYSTIQPAGNYPANVAIASLFGPDYSDYYIESGWEAGLRARYKLLSGSINTRFSRQFSANNQVERPILNSTPYRANPEIMDGNWRTISSEISWNYTTSVLPQLAFDTRIGFRLRAVHAELLENSFTWRQAEAAAQLQQPTFGTGYAPMNLRISFFAGIADKYAPVQGLFPMLQASAALPQFGDFLTAPAGRMGGTSYVRAAAEHNFSDLFWRAAGLPLYEGRGIEFILTAATGRYFNPAATGPYTSTGTEWYTEAGFGIGKIPIFVSNVIFLRFDASFGVLGMAKGRSGWSIGASTPF